MKQLMSARINRHLFSIKKQIPVLTYTTNQCRNYFSMIKLIQEPRNDLPKLTLFSKKLENSLKKKFSTDFQSGNNLMDFEVWTNPTFLNSLKMWYLFVKLNRIDESFSTQEFLSSANIALQVVVSLLSQLRFSELEGLLTPECKEEVERNIQLWPPSQVSALAFKPEQLSVPIPGDIAIFSDEKERERLFIEIRLIHWLFIRSPVNKEKPYSLTVLLNALQIKNSDNFYVHGFFNTKFIREYTEGVNDQWTISAINVKYIPQDVF